MCFSIWHLISNEILKMSNYMTLFSWMFRARSTIVKVSVQLQDKSRKFCDLQNDILGTQRITVIREKATRRIRVLPNISQKYPCRECKNSLRRHKYFRSYWPVKTLQNFVERLRPCKYRHLTAISQEINLRSDFMIYIHITIYVISISLNIFLDSFVNIQFFSFFFFERLYFYAKTILYTYFILTLIQTRNL